MNQRTDGQIEGEITHLFLRDDQRDWGEFFVHEREPRVDDRGHTHHAATWIAYTSFGVFGHHWNGMGAPFAKFIQGVDQGYLLGKIAKDVRDPDKAVEGIRRSILINRRCQTISQEDARTAWDAVERIADEYDREHWAVLMYEDADVSKGRIQWVDISTTSKDPDAVFFSERLWPVFVKEMAKRLEVEHAPGIV